MRCTLVGSALIAGLAGCAPPLERNCRSTFYEKAAFEGAFVHRVVDVTTLEGAYVPPRTTTEARPARLGFGESLLIGDLGGSTFAVRVIDHFAGSLSPDAPCGVRLAADPFGGSWEERALARIDWSMDLGDILREIDPGPVVIEPIPSPYETELDLYGLSIESDGFTITTRYLVTPEVRVLAIHTSPIPPAASLWRML